MSFPPVLHIHPNAVLCRGSNHGEYNGTVEYCPQNIPTEFRFQSIIDTALAEKQNTEKQNFQVMIDPAEGRKTLERIGE